MLQAQRLGTKHLGARSARLVVRAQQQSQRPPARLNGPPPPPPRPPVGFAQEQSYQYGEASGQPGRAAATHSTVTDSKASRNSPPGPPGGPPKDSTGLGGLARALVAAAFVMGLGIGTWFDSEVVLTPANVSSTEIIDRAVPNADICMANGYSAQVMSLNLFVTYNPFNVYISQPQVKGGCVLRRANVGLLEREKLVTPRDVDLCKQRMNTFAYVGDLKDGPEVACVYHSEEAENQYLEVLGNRQRLSQLLMQPQQQATAEGKSSG